MSKQTASSSTSSAKVSHALKVLAQLREKREEEMAGLPTDAIHDESDVENDSLSPIFDRFYANGGSQTLIEMSNFNFNEIERLWHRCSTVLTQSFMLGRGKKTDVAPKDLLFIVLCVLKAATNWDLMGEIFEKKRTYTSTSVYTCCGHFEPPSSQGIPDSLSQQFDHEEAHQDEFSIQELPVCPIRNRCHLQTIEPSVGKFDGG
jgi:hypothetical protein